MYPGRRIVGDWARQVRSLPSAREVDQRARGVRDSEASFAATSGKVDIFSYLNF